MNQIEPSQDLKTRLSSDLARLKNECDREDLQVSEFLNILGYRGHALIILFLCVPFLTPIPMPGLSTLFGILMILTGVGIMSGRPPWLPEKLKNKTLPRKVLVSLFYWAEKIFLRLEFLFRPRGEVIMASRWLRYLEGIVIILSASFLALPLPPGTNFPPAITMFCLAIGTLERDLFMTTLGFIFFAIKMVVLYWLLTFGAEQLPALLNYF